MEPEALRIDGARLWRRLMEMARIGATPAGGCDRQALTDQDRAGRDLFARWCRDLGCELRVDAIGNVFARRPGRDPDAPPVLFGSHLDTQPTGGKFDGVYGVLAALEVLESLREVGVVTRAPLEAVVWTNEEGARFSPAMLGSGVWAGVFDLDEARAIRDKAGRSVGEELERIGYCGDVAARATPMAAAFEVHIEQGPILEREGRQIGVVTGAQGMRWYDMILEGEACHAGPTPMELRRDPCVPLPAILSALYDLARKHAPWARATFGDFRAEPGVRNTVPERLTVSVDLRHPDAAVLAEMDASFRRSVLEASQAAGIAGRVRDEWSSPAVAFAPMCVEAVRRATLELGYTHLDMVSGAGHDSVYLARVLPTGMIFVPCEKGLSHNEAESAKPEDLEAGCNVLLHAVLRCAESRDATASKGVGDE
jgi:beta-ureidopropionase / N-carbamoyl-L-amino-acid hydrolase